MVTIDSYSESNQDGQGSLKTVHPSAEALNSAIGQCFTGLAGHKMTSCKFYLEKVGSPIGNLVAHLYAHTGTYGTDGKPTGSVLTTSDAVAMAGLGAFALVTFTFSTPYVLSSAYYCICVVAESATTLDADNYVRVGYDSSGPTHSGNLFYHNDGNWEYSGTGSDCCFYVLGLVPPKGNAGNLMLAVNF